MRPVILSLAVGLLTFPGSLLAAPKISCVLNETATLSTTQTLSFDPDGVIQIEQSFGDMEIEGWDRAEVEITTIRPSVAGPSATLTALKQGEDRLKISTGRAERGRMGLQYIIKAPARATLVLHHYAGGIRFAHFAGDVEVSNPAKSGSGSRNIKW